MGFRTGSYATVWQVEPKSNTMTRMRISITRKNRQTGEYEQDFSGYVIAVGSAAAQKAASLKEKDRIRLGDVDVCTTYIKERQKEYIDYKIFSFELADEASGNNNQNRQPAARYTDNSPVQGDEMDEDQLPF